MYLLIIYLYMYFIHIYILDMIIRTSWRSDRKSNLDTIAFMINSVTSVLILKNIFLLLAIIFRQGFVFSSHV